MLLFFLWFIYWVIIKIFCFTNGKRKRAIRQSDSVAYFWAVQFSSSVVSNSLQPHGLQHIRLLCPSPTPEAYSNSGPLSRWCHPTISSSVVPFSSHLQSFPESGIFFKWVRAEHGQSLLLNRPPPCPKWGNPQAWCAIMSTRGQREQKEYFSCKT